MFTKDDEAPLVRGDGGGLVPDGDGWFVVNVAERGRCTRSGSATAAALRATAASPSSASTYACCSLATASLYHREDAQEAFLVLSGECLAIVEEQERRLRAGDFVYARPARPTCSSGPATARA